MESKKCNKCGKDKPVNMFYKLRKDKPWRRSKCISCHRRVDDVNRKIRIGNLFGLVILLMLFSFPALSQTIETQRKVIVDSINYYRADPVKRVLESYDIALDRRFKPINEYVLNDKLTRSAQKWADKMARTGNYWHSNTRHAESIDAVQGWQGGSEQSVSRFIIDKHVPNKGHRTHMLAWPDGLIGIGIAVSNEGETFICIQTSTE